VVVSVGIGISSVGRACSHDAELSDLGKQHLGFPLRYSSAVIGSGNLHSRVTLIVVQAYESDL
jgi:hypothetical protein